MYKYSITVIGDNEERKIIKTTSVNPTNHLPFFINLFEQWYSNYEILSIKLIKK